MYIYMYIYKYIYIYIYIYMFISSFFLFSDFYLFHSSVYTAIYLKVLVPILRLIKPFSLCSISVFLKLEVLIHLIIKKGSNFFDDAFSSSILRSFLLCSIS